MIYKDESILCNGFRDIMKDAAKKFKDPSLCAEQGCYISYPTTFLPLDYMNGLRIPITTMEEDVQFVYDSLGIAEGSINMIVGPTSTAKTTLAIQMACRITQRFQASCVIHEDAEAATNKSRIQNISGWNSKMIKNKYIIRDVGITTDSFFQRAVAHCKQKMLLANQYPDTLYYNTGIIDEEKQMVKKLVPTVIIMDSLPMLMPVKMAEDEGFGSNMNAAHVAKANTIMFKKLIPLIKEANVIIFLINHLQDNINTNAFLPQAAQINYLKQSEKIPGGNAVLYLVNNIFRMSKVSNLVDTKDFGINGWIARSTIIKSRSNRAGQDVPLVYNQEYGFDSILSSYMLLKSNDRIKSNGAWFYFDGLETSKFQQKYLTQKMQEDAKLRLFFKESIKEFGSDCLSGSKAFVQKEARSSEDEDAIGSAYKDQILSSLMDDADFSIGI